MAFSLHKILYSPIMEKRWWIFKFNTFTSVTISKEKQKNYCCKYTYLRDTSHTDGNVHLVVSQKIILIVSNCVTFTKAKKKKYL